MTKGYVYILTNEAMPGLVKIGKTTRDPASRAVELHQTGVPFPFVVAESVVAPDCHDLERYIHSTLDEFRVRPDREFFRCDLNTARQALIDCHLEHVEFWLDDYLPDHKPIRSEFVLDESVTEYLANFYGLNSIEMIDALSLLTPEEVEGAVNRLREMYRRKIRKADERNAQDSGGIQ
jgi:hypothetical protein